MFTVSLKLVRPSPTPIRKTWDEDKMNELAASIKERGVIVPIKVRPVSDKFRECRMHGLSWLEGVQLNEHDESCFYCGELRGIHGIYQDWELEEDEDLERGKPFLEIVYGHRRVEAARRAGLEEIPAIVEAAEDDQTLIEALIENIQREDMTSVDIALGLQALKELTGSTNDKLAQMFGWKSASAVGNYLQMLREDVLPVMMEHRGVLDANDFMEVRAGLGKEQHVAPDILRKTAAEDLTRAETRHVADAYKAAPTPELKAAVLNTSGKLGDADRILQVAQMNIGAAGLVERNEHERRQAFEDYDRAVKDFLDAMKLFDRMLKTARDAAKYGKFSAEGARFAVGRIDKLIDELETLKEVLSHVDAN